MWKHHDQNWKTSVSSEHTIYFVCTCLLAVVPAREEVGVVEDLDHRGRIVVHGVGLEPEEGVARRADHAEEL